MAVEKPLNRFEKEYIIVFFQFRTRILPVYVDAFIVIGNVKIKETIL